MENKATLLQAPPVKSSCYEEYMYQVKEQVDFNFNNSEYIQNIDDKHSINLVIAVQR